MRLKTFTRHSKNLTILLQRLKPNIAKQIMMQIKQCTDYEISFTHISSSMCQTKIFPIKLPDLNKINTLLHASFYDSFILKSDKSLFETSQKAGVRHILDCYKSELHLPHNLESEDIL
jgi:hypothetical protein